MSRPLTISPTANGIPAPLNIVRTPRPLTLSVGLVIVFVAVALTAISKPSTSAATAGTVVTVIAFPVPPAMP